MRVRDAGRIVGAACRHRRDRHERRDGDASAGIPGHLLVDRDGHHLTVYSEPDGGTYRSRTSHDFGSVVEIPEPVDITLETQKLQDYTH